MIPWSTCGSQVALIGTHRFVVYDVAKSVPLMNTLSPLSLVRSEWTILLFRLLCGLNVYHHRAISPLSPLVDLVYFSRKAQAALDPAFGAICPKAGPSAMGAG